MMRNIVSVRKFCWLPVRKARLTGSHMAFSSLPEIEIIGWVWLKNVNMVNNVNHGWLAFTDEIYTTKR